jgi:exopolysaccharide biosynthesis polyprenyl glycosylphosphotransferase
MLKRDYQLRHEIDQLVDALIGAFALTIAILIRRDIILPWHPDIFPVFDFWPQAGWLYLVLVGIWVLLYDAFGLYKHRGAHSVAKTTAILGRANAVGVVLAFFIFYFITEKNIPRILIFLYAGINFSLVWLKELLHRHFAPRWESRKIVLLVGAPSEFAAFLSRVPTSAAGDGSQPSAVDGLPVLGTPSDLPEILHRSPVDFVAFNPSQERFDEIQNLITVCETEGVEVWLLGSFFRTDIARAAVDEFQDLPMLTFRTVPPTSWALILKRAIDVTGSLLALLLFGPLMIAVAILTKLTSPGPVLFRQYRCTVRGRGFWMYKFRTMVAEAETMRPALQALNEVTGPAFKIRRDPRVTPLGRFLRRYSIDELPQFFNVLKGEMSLVGPRPPIPDEVKEYASWHRRRLSMRPGLTCLWQIEGRNSLPFEDWMRLDLKYIDNWSLALDMRILLRTPRAVLRGTGL